MSYTLANYYEDSGVICDMSWAEKVDMKFEPDPHQKTGLSRALADIKFGLYDECDTGKTCVMQAFAMFYASHGNKVIGVMLPVLTHQFKESIFDTFQGAEEIFNVHIFNQTPAKRRSLKEEWLEKGNCPDILLVSYQLFAKEYLDFIELGYEVYVADECDMMCNPETLANKAMQVCTSGDEVAYLGATGTPNRRELLDCYGLIKLNNPEAYECKEHFERVHVEYFHNQIAGGRTQKVIIDYNNLGLMTRNLYARARRVTKLSIGRDSNPRVSLVPIELASKHYTLYRKVLKERILEVDGELIDGVTAQALRQIAMRIVTTPELYCDKDSKIPNSIYEAIDVLLSCADVENSDKVILFAHYKTTIKSLMARYAHLNPALMFGENSSKHKEQKAKFCFDSDCRVLIANTVSAGVGVDGFQHVSSREIFVEPQAVPRNFTQAVERVNRRGQTKTCTIHILSALRTMYPARIDMMLERNHYIKQVNQDKSSFLDELYGTARN